MRNLLLVAVAVVGLLDCEQRFSSEPPPIVPGGHAPASSSGAIDALLRPSSTDAGSAAVDGTHAVTVTACSASSQPCPASDSESADARYRVAFGSGRAQIRTRGQAMADLYKELRDRTAAGERLDAEPRARGDAGPTVGGGGGAGSGTSDGDPISQCAFHLLDLVDGVGEVTLDIVHSGPSGCLVSLGGASRGGVLQCLVKGPERPKGPGGGGMSF